MRLHFFYLNFAQVVTFRLQCLSSESVLVSTEGHIGQLPIGNISAECLGTL